MEIIGAGRNSEPEGDLFGIDVSARKDGLIRRHRKKVDRWGRGIAADRQPLCRQPSGDVAGYRHGEARCFPQ